MTTTTYAARGVGGASTSASTIVSSYANDRRRCATFSRRRVVATRGGRAEDESTTSLADDDGVYVFVNRKSGGRQGGRILRRLRKVLKPPNYIFDATKVHKLVAAGEPTLVSPWPENARVLVCGGDGTVGLVHDALERARETQDVKRELPPMAIAPLGTGNDLARVLGWHGDVWNENRLYDESELVRAVRGAVPRAVDRWRVQFTPISNETTTTDMTTTTKLFTNYMSVGVDARAALAFHRARKDERWTWLFAHELTNKLLYAIFGSRDFIEHSFAGLRDEIFVQVDGVPIELPEDTEGLVFLNINSFSGGCRMWWHDDDDDDDDAEDTPPPRSNNSFKPSRMDDGVLEIVAVSGALQLGQLNVRMPSVRPVRVAQGSDVKITIRGRRGRRKFPMQVDGEPWNQNRDTIVRVNRLEEESPAASSLVMLSRPKEERLADVIAKWFAANHSSDDGDDADTEGSTKRRRRRTTMPFVRVLVRAICFAVAATFVFFARRVAVL